MPTKPELIDRVTTLARENQLVLPPSSSTTAAEPDRPLDSIALLELLVALEQEFQISLMDEELDAANRLKSMDALADLILEKMSSNDS